MANISDYYREKAAEAEAAKNPPRPAPVHAARVWSEAVRTVRMGILPPGELPVDEITDWIAFCEEQGNADAAEVARTVMKQAGKGTAPA